MLFLTKATDLLTTIVGLSVVGQLVEQNPFAAVVYHLGGVAALVASNVVSLLVVILVVEWAHGVLRATESAALSPSVVYLISYLPLSVLFYLATVHNLVLLVRVA